MRHGILTTTVMLMLAPFARAQQPPAPVAPAVISRNEAKQATVRAVKLAEPLRIDGRLDEVVYSATLPITDFIQTLPRNGEEPTEKTEAIAALGKEFGAPTAADMAKLPSEVLVAYDKKMAEIELKWPRASVKDLVDQIDYAVKKAGIETVGISSDFNGGGGVVGGMPTFWAMPPKLVHGAGAAAGIALMTMGAGEIHLALAAIIGFAAALVVLAVGLVNLHVDRHAA